MSEISGEVKARLILATADIIINKGLPALSDMVTKLNKKEVVTIEDIESVKGDLDSASYFE